MLLLFPFLFFLSFVRPFFPLNCFSGGHKKSLGLDTNECIRISKMYIFSLCYLDKNDEFFSHTVEPFSIFFFFCFIRLRKILRPFEARKEFAYTYISGTKWFYLAHKFHWNQRWTHTKRKLKLNPEVPCLINRVYSFHFENIKWQM